MLVFRPFDLACKAKVFGHPRITTLIITNEEIDDIMKIIKSSEESGLLIKYISETIKNEAKG